MARKTKEDARVRRKVSIRKRLAGTSERPRVSVFRSARHIYAQVINDDTGSTLVSASTLSPELEETLKGQKKAEQAKLVGALLAKKCQEAKIEKIVFDRNGFIYHGRVKALADGAREAGLKF
jgi:large subunit ribosomal protein L18